MVKGVARRVIMVKSPDPRLFEQAIFIVREDAIAKGVSAEQVLKEARRVADGYVRRNAPMTKWFRKIPPPVYAVAGALVSTAAWALALYF